MASRGRSSKNTLRISIEKSNRKVSNDTFTSVRYKNNRSGSQKSEMETLVLQVYSALQDLTFDVASEIAFLLVKKYPNNIHNMLLYAKTLLSNREYRSALFWIQQSQVLDSLYSSDKLDIVNLYHMKSLSPWHSKNAEFEFDFFNFEANESQGYDAPKHKLLYENSMEPSCDKSFIVKVGFMAVECLIGCMEIEQAIDLIDHFIHEETIENIFHKARYLKCEKVYSNLCLRRSEILLEEGRAEEAIFYLKASVRCYPLNLKAQKILKNYQLEPNEKAEFIHEIQQNDTNAFSPIRLKEFSFSSLEIESVRKQLFLGKSSCALQAARNLLATNPHRLEYQGLFVECLLENANKTELFSYAHVCSKYEPDSCISYFSVGCYYFLQKKYADAGKRFRFATIRNKFFLPAWYLFGKCFSKDGISNKALAVYEFASTLFVGSYLFPLAIALEYQTQNNLALVHYYLARTVDLNDENNPVVFAHLATVHLEMQNLQTADIFFSKFYAFVKPELENSEVLLKWTSTLVNYGHCLRKQGKLQAAISIYNLCTFKSSNNILEYLGISYYTLFKVKEITFLQKNEKNIKQQIFFLKQAVSFFETANTIHGNIFVQSTLKSALIDYKLIQREISQGVTFKVQTEQELTDVLAVDLVLENKLNTMDIQCETNAIEVADHTFLQPASKLYTKLKFNTAKESNDNLPGMSQEEDNKLSGSSYGSFDGYQSPPALEISDVPFDSSILGFTSRTDSGSRNLSFFGEQQTAQASSVHEFGFGSINSQDEGN